MDPRPKTPEEQIRERIEIISKLPLGAEPRAQLILILLGEKPATDLTWQPEKITPDELSGLLRSAGLATERVSDDSGVITMAVARDSATVAKLVELQANRDHEEFGRLMGFPESAIAAFTGKTERLPYNEQKQLVGKLPFFQFAFSKDNFADELALLRRWNLAVFRAAPGLIDEVWNEQDAAEIKRGLEELETINKREI